MTLRVFATPRYGAVNLDWQRRFAELMQQAGHPHEAWVKAEPLFAAYPAVQAVQDLRRKLALQQGMGWQQARAECAGLMQLTPGLRGPNRAR